MTQGFFQFNNSIITEIRNFTNSSFDLLFLSGLKGSAKSETIEKILPELEENNLVFQHFCFENTVIDDFLLNFYDALRSFAIAQKISLKKFVTDNFKEKVSHYFKTIDSNCIIIVENFEKIDSNVEIINFLSHLATYTNVKIIITTRNKDKNLFRFKKIRTQTLEMEEINKEDFKSRLTVLVEPTSLEVKEKFYEITSGLELYLKMSIKYCSTTNSTISDLINEYERNSKSTHLSYEEFLVTKFTSLVPNIYKNLLKLLSAISNPVSINFLNQYNLGTKTHVEYLATNLLVNRFKGEFYVKDYFSQYIAQGFSIQEKVTYYSNLIKIFENELTKSPKDRLLRLSRESIRKEIELFKSKIPAINANENAQTFSYLGIGNSSWENEKTVQKSKLSEKLNKIKERKKFLTQEKNSLPQINQTQTLQERKEEDNKIKIINLINHSRDLNKNYKYFEAIEKLDEALLLDNNNEFKIEILILSAKNYELLNKFDLATKNYQKALTYAKEIRDSRICEIEFLIATLEKNTFKIEEAKDKFISIIENASYPKHFIAKANLELGEIEEANSNIEYAINCYKNALEISLGKDKALVCKSYYKLAVLYDEHQDWQNAIKYYQKNYTTSSESSENKYYSVSLTNLALIYIEQENYKQASEYLKLALIYDSELNDLENMYFSQKELAKLYSRFDEIQAMKYFKQAQDSAKKLNDTFKEALIHFEVGQYYYEKQDDKKALENFFSAKLILKKSSDNENIQRVDSRINDIKMRFNKEKFEEIKNLYDKK